MSDIAPDDIPPTLAAVGADLAAVGADLAAVGADLAAVGADTEVDSLGADLAAVGADTEVSSVGSSQEEVSDSVHPVGNGEPASTPEGSDSVPPVGDGETASTPEGSDSSNPVGNGETASAPESSGSSHGQRHTWKARTSFTADSPYFTSFCDGEIKSLQILSDSLRDISARTKTFCKTGALMSEAMRRLANSCKLRQERNSSQDDADEERLETEDIVQQRRHAVGEEMATLLQLLGEVSQSVSGTNRIGT
jgi:hypothetical protein